MTAQLIQKMIQYFGTDVRRINHALKVYGFTHAICRTTSMSDLEIYCAELASIIHDIGIKVAEEKYNSCAGHYQELEGPAVARIILMELGVDVTIIERVCFLIGHHHTYTKIDGIDFQILVEADFLVNIFEDEFSKESIDSVKKKYFKTETGIQLINTMYC